MSETTLDIATLMRMKAQHPALWRKLVKAARKAEGRQPVRTDAGDAKRALYAVSQAIRGATTGKRARKDAKAIKRAMRDQTLTTSSDDL